MIVDGSRTIELTQSELNTLYSDNEALLSALKTCKGGKK